MNEAERPKVRHPGLRQDDAFVVSEYLTVREAGKESLTTVLRENPSPRQIGTTIE